MEIKILKSLIYITLVFGGIFALWYYIFDGDINYWMLSLVPISKNVLFLGWKYMGIVKRKNSKNFVVLKISNIEIDDISFIIVTLGFVAYIRLDIVLYTLPIAIINVILLFLVKKNQLYHFSEWYILNLSGSDDDISIEYIQKIDLQPNKLIIDYLENDPTYAPDPKDIKKLVIHRKELIKPNSWYEFEKMISNYEVTHQNQIELLTKRNIV